MGTKENFNKVPHIKELENGNHSKKELSTFSVSYLFSTFSVSYLFEDVAFYNLARRPEHIIPKMCAFQISSLQLFQECTFLVLSCDRDLE